MADLRCPMCGKSNPPAAEKCQHCKAQLTPLAPPQDNGEADWLRDLRDEGLLGGQPTSPEVPTPAEEPPAQPAEMPDWLSRIRERTQQEEDAVSRIGSAPRIEEGQPPTSESTPDWLRDIPLAASDASGIPSWMREAQPNSEEPAVPTPPSAPQPNPLSDSADSLENDDWLRSLGSWTGESSPPAAAPGEPVQAFSELPETSPALPAEETPAWLNALETPAAPVDPENLTPQQEAQPAAAETDLSDWLHSLEAQTPTPSPVEPIESTPPHSQPASADLSDWLDSLEAETPTLSESTEPAAPEAVQPTSTGMTDFLKSLEAQTLAPQEVVEPAESTAAGDMPEWMQTLGGEPPAPVVPAEPSEPEAIQPTSTGMTDFLKSLQAEAAPTAPEAQEVSEPIPQTDRPATGMTDFLRSLEQQTTPPVPLQPSEPDEPEAVQPTSTGMTDWLRSLQQEPTGATTSQPPAEESIPDWLTPAEAEAPAATPAFTEPPLASADLPEWLRAVEPQQPAPGTPAFSGFAQPEPIEPFTGEDLTPWVSSSEPIPGAQEAYELPAFTVPTEGETLSTENPLAKDEDIPAWLSASAPVEPEITEEPINTIEQAQLPTWLQAMRPVEAAVQTRSASLDEERIEKAGPLAGMSGVLPGEEIVTQYRKPPIYSSRLRVSDKQQVLANLLESVVAEESLTQPLQAESNQATQFIVRLLISLLLIAAVVIGLLAKPLLGVSKAQIAPGTPAHEIFRQLDDLPAGAPILLVVDYEAGLSGEMETAALPVIQHLMSRKVRLVLLSTQPVGPILGEELLRQAVNSRSGVTAYSIPQTTANLGYLVGGAPALKELSTPMSGSRPRPLQQSLPSPMRAEGGWDGQVLKSLSQITDFKRVILLTDSYETGRAWVEQVQPAIARRVPFIAITSAQAAPLLQPYQTSGQITLLLYGMVGGRTYEEQTLRPAGATAYWNAYQAGLWLAIVLILAGGLVGGIQMFIARTKKQNQARG